MIQPVPHIARIHMDSPFAAESLALSIGGINQENQLVIVCVGTDRSTGDALGPLIGTQLSAAKHPISVYGTLENPVHALNLEKQVVNIKIKHPHATILAVDACLGKSENVGYISLKKGPLKPGTGVNKQLPVVGDYHIVGVVNVGGFMEYFVLQNTRLSLVMKMANIIAEGLLIYFQNRTVTTPWPVSSSIYP